MGKRCLQCKKIKPEEEFGKYASPSGKPYRRRRCNSCRVEGARRRYFNNPEVRRKALLTSERQRIEALYGITLEDKKLMEKKQKGKCLICKKVKKLHIDHCHNTGRVRGLLCGSCNRGLGLFQESPQFLHNAIKYIL